jgi:head-tail adaptor
VVEAREPVAIQPGVEKAKWGLAVRNKVVIKQRDYTRHRLDIVCQLGARG